MNNDKKIKTCNDHWNAASQYHKEVLELVPALSLAQGLYDYPNRVKGYLYPLVIFIEASVLSLQLYSEVQLLLQGVPVFVYALVTVALAILLALLLDALVFAILPLTGSQLYLHFMEKTYASKLMYPKHWLLGQRAKPLSNHPVLACIVLGVMVIGLSIARGILINRQSGLEDWDLTWIALSILISLLLIGFALILAPHYQRWSYLRGLKKQQRKAIQKRGYHIDEFFKAASQLVDFPQVSGTLLPSAVITPQQQTIHDRYLALNNDDGSYACLIPTQRQYIEVYANGEAADGVKVYGLFGHDKFEMTLSDSNGRACLEWRSYEPGLKMLSIGPHQVNNFQPTTHPLKVELFKNSPSTLKID